MKKRKSSLARISAFRHSDIEQYREWKEQMGYASSSTCSSQSDLSEKGLSGSLQDLTSSAGGLNGFNRYGSLSRTTSQLELDYQE